jgi:GH24 family phage-related lysozyme (muramidase)
MAIMPQKFEEALKILQPLLKKHEGFRSNAYKDIVGVVTIGYGFTAAVIPGLKMGDTMSREKADKLLLQFSRDNYALPVWNAITVRNDPRFTAEMFAAIVSLAYNVGVTKINNSSLVKKLNAGDFTGAKDEFIKWNKAGGKEVKGLTSRRVDEANLFAAGLAKVVAAVREAATKVGTIVKERPVAAGVGVGTIVLLGLASYLLFKAQKSSPSPKLA